MALIKPETGWKSGDGVAAGDLNRIESNINSILLDVIDIGEMRYNSGPVCYGTWTTRLGEAHLLLPPKSALAVIRATISADDMNGSTYLSIGNYDGADIKKVFYVDSNGFFFKTTNLLDENFFIYKNDGYSNQTHELSFWANGNGNGSGDSWLVRHWQFRFAVVPLPQSE